MQLLKYIAASIISLHNLYNRFANNFIAHIFSIINCLNLSMLPFCACISRAHGSNKILLLQHYYSALIQFILLLDWIILTSKQYCSASQATKSYTSGKFSSFFADWVKYIKTMPVTLYITIIVCCTSAPFSWYLSHPSFKLS